MEPQKHEEFQFSRILKYDKRIDTIPILSMINLSLFQIFSLSTFHNSEFDAKRMDR